jgi:hypothetical protein
MRRSDSKTPSTRLNLIVYPLGNRSKDFLPFFSELCQQAGKLHDEFNILYNEGSVISGVQTHVQSL